MKRFLFATGRSLRRNIWSLKVFIDFAISLPAWFSRNRVHRVNETVFRKTVLVLLLVSGFR